MLLHVLLIMLFTCPWCRACVLLRALLTRANPEPARIPMLTLTLIRTRAQPARRFLQDLPPGLHEMNDHLLHAAFPPEVQPVQEIMQILQARLPKPRVPDVRQTSPCSGRSG